jgi:hypothetical protein
VGYADTVMSEYSYLFGIDSDLNEDSTFMVDMPHIRFGDTANGYEFPPDDGNAGQVMATDGSGQLGWTDMAGGAQHSGAVYRWIRWNTYSNTWSQWMAGNDASLFGGVEPREWGDLGATAGDMSTDMGVLRAFFTRKGYAGANAMIAADEWLSYSSTNSKHTAVLFRVKNTTGGDIVWNLSFWYTSYPSWGEPASVALNGTDIWVSPSSALLSTSVALTIPGNLTSTVIVVSGSTSQSAGMTRANLLAFFDDCLELPAGLEYVDDLDIATALIE